MTVLSAHDVGLLRSGRHLLSGVTTGLGPTGSVAIIGPNGAGKSTLVKCLTGILAPTSGEVRLNGAPLLSVAASRRAREIGYMPQHFAPHWDMPVKDLMRISMERSGVYARDEALEAELDVHGLQSFIDRRWSTLSGGERARVLLAMVVATNPAVLIADEPAASLDVRNKLDVTKQLLAYSKTALVAVVVHDLDLALNHYDRVLLLSRGAVAADRPAADLIHDPIVDEAFGIRFRRVPVGTATLLRAADHDLL